MNDDLIEFVKEAKKAGRSLFEVGEVLRRSGWDEAQVNETLSRFVEGDLPVAIPRPIPFASPRLVALTIFHFLMLYSAVYNVIAVLFTMLDYYIPDGLGRMQGFYYSLHLTIGEALRDNLSVLAICVPLAIVSQKAITAAMRGAQQRIPRIRLRFIYATLLFGALALTCNAASLVYYLLAGELGVRIVLKFLILAGAVTWVYVVYRLEIQETEVAS
jgi:Domain of unknown function (DUF5671)